MIQDVKPICLSFFTGAMGLDLGLEQSGFDTRLAVEIDPAARATIQANRPNLPVLEDVELCTPEVVRKAAGLDESSLVHLLAGGPPCQAFSTMGQRGGLEDKRGGVILRYLTIIDQFKPWYVVIENVRGLLCASKDDVRGGVLKLILSILKSMGYEVSFNLYNTANYGVPQIRERLILICSLRGRVPWLAPTHSEDGFLGLPPWITFRQAVAGLPSEPFECAKLSENRLKFYRMLKEGQNWKHLPVDVQQEAMKGSFFSGGGRTGHFRRLAWDRPAPTLVTSPTQLATGLVHPDEDRPLSVQEYKRIQCFPDDWIMKGSLDDKYRQIGNAVPVKFGEIVGKTIMAHMKSQPLQEHPDFHYSRYTRTSEKDWV